MLDGFEGFEPNYAAHRIPVLEISEENSLEEKYGRFAQDSWIDRELSLSKMDAIMSDLQEGSILSRLRGLLSKNLEILAISKEELTPAAVEPFHIELNDSTPCYERPLRYNPTLTKFVNDEV